MAHKKIEFELPDGSLATDLTQTQEKILSGIMKNKNLSFLEMLSIINGHEVKTFKGQVMDGRIKVHVSNINRALEKAGSQFRIFNLRKYGYEIDSVKNCNPTTNPKQDGDNR